MPVAESAAVVSSTASARAQPLARKHARAHQELQAARTRTHASRTRKRKHTRSANPCPATPGKLCKL